MAGYADKTFYEDVYHGTAIPADERETALERSRWAIDAAVGFAIKDLTDLSEFAQRQVKLASCAQADHEFLFGDMTGTLDIIGGYTIGDVSVSPGGAKTGRAAWADHYQLGPDALNFLYPTGLLDRRLR